MSVQAATTALNLTSWVILGVLGLAFGSFATVLESRVQHGRSVVVPPSACPHCAHTLRWYENIPVLSYLALRGKCYHCRRPISAKYPLIELTTAGLFVMAFQPMSDSSAFATVNPPDFQPGNIAMSAMAVISVPLTLIDFRVHRLPNALTYPVGILLITVMAWVSISEKSAYESSNVFLQGFIPAAALFVLGIVSRGGMGLGDVKLAALMGWSIGWFGIGATVTSFVAAFILGGAWGIALLVTRRAGRKSAIPFGPFLVAGLWASFALGHYWQNIVLSLWGL